MPEKWPGRAFIQFEGTDNTFKVFRLFLQGMGSSSSLLHQSGILLGDLIHLVNRTAYPLNATGLTGAGGGNFSHDVRDMFDAVDNVIHRAASLLHQDAASIDLADRVADQGFDFLCSIC